MKDIIRNLADKDQHNLKLRFQVGLGIILFCFCLFTTTIIYHFQKNLLEEETLRQAELVMTSLESTRSYIREVLRPKMYKEIGEDRFIIEAMSTSYITRVIMDRFKEKLPAFQYRRVAVNARNPNFEANKQEEEMIGFFRKNPDSQEWHGMTRLNSERYFSLYRPVVFALSCLHCHGKPEQAPPAINDSYGSKLGFHRKINEIKGLQSISIPVEISLNQIWRNSFRMFGVVLLLAALLYATIWLLFHQLIISNLSDLLTLFRASIDTGDTVSRPVPKRGHKEELEELFQNARTLITHLHDSRTKLVEYTDNLEGMVAERTEALERSQNRLQHQVKKRNRELTLLNTLTGLITSTETLQSILHQVLREVLQVVPANGAGIYLYQEKEEVFTLQCVEQADMLPKHITDSVNLPPGEPQYTTGCDQIKVTFSKTDNSLSISVPLCCRNRLRGIMVITELSAEVLHDDLKDLLLSIGQQIGQTIESLQNIQNLRSSSDLLQSVFDGISDPLILLAPDGTLKMVNQAFLQRHELTIGDVLGKNAENIQPKQHSFLGTGLQNFDLHINTPHTKEIQLDDGSVFDVYFYPITRKDQTVRAIVCFAKDVTDIMETKRRIQQTEKLVAIGQLAAGVAHEINNPLGVILCYTDVIKDTIKDDKELTKDITVIERHAENCRRIVADLLDFSRSRENRIKKRLESVNDAIADVLTMVRQQFLKKNIEIQTDLDETIPPCLIDSRRLKQVLLNLIMNSSQAIEDRGSISLSSGKDNGNIVIAIEDDGPGISKDIIDKVFDPFFSTKESGHGTGLGLSVSYGIVREHDGDIHVQSTPGKGTRFTVIIPAGREEVNNEQ